MFETEEQIVELQVLLDRSYERSARTRPRSSRRTGA
jgi:hypothetical protein